MNLILTERTRVTRPSDSPILCILIALTAGLAGNAAAASATVSVTPAGRPGGGFTNLPPALTGITFSNPLAEQSSANNRILENGSGVALGDVDGDGRCDVYFCRLEGGNVLYRNLGGWRFEDITARAGVACDGQYSTGAVFADVDGDRDLDLLVNAIGAGTRLFLGDGKGQFTEKTDGRLARGFGATSMALADMDGDGDLDLYVTNYRTTTYRDRPPGLQVEARMVEGKIVVTPEDRFIPIVPRGGAVEVIEKGERDVLYMNAGGGRFVPISWTGGAFLDERGNKLTEPPMDWGLSAMFRDANQDGHPDLYVCNDFFYFPDRFWLSEGSRQFRAASSSQLREVSLSSMAVDFADIDRDGFDDFVVVDMLSRDRRARHWQRPNTMRGSISMPYEDPAFRPEVTRNTLFHNRGDGTYAEIAQLSGLDATEWSWGALFLDVDLDGYEDLLVPAGNNHDVQDADVLREQSMRREAPTPENKLRNWSRFPKLEQPILAYRNRHDLTFEDRGIVWGFQERGIANGAALGDLDNDGDLDLVVNRLNGAAAVYRNEAPGPRLCVRLAGRTPNTRGIGARIRVTDRSGLVQSQEMIAGGRYLSGDDALRTFAAPDATSPLRVEVTWRDGGLSVIDAVAPNSILTVAQDQATPPTPAAPPPLPEALFADASDRLGHRHRDDPFDDFGRQPLLSRRMSSLGLGIACTDLDNDGWEDVVIGTGRGAVPGVFLNDRQGGWQTTNLFGVPPVSVQDWSGLALWSRAGHTRLLVAMLPDSNDLGTAHGFQAWSLRENPVPGPATHGSGPVGGFGPLAVADVDLDGDLDVFAGGRLRPGAYPQAPASRLLLEGAGGWSDAAGATQRFANLGMVSGAVFSDLDADGDADLVTATEWGGIRIWRNDRGDWSETTRELGLADFTGWWNAVTTGDFDGDGRLDIVASNWGRNTRHQSALAQPLRLYHGDFDGNGVVDVIEGEALPSGSYLPWRPWDVVTAAMPKLAERFPTYRAYAESTLPAMLGAAEPAVPLTAATLDSMVFLNRGNRFEPRALPVEAQTAPAFGISVADFDGDGHEDLFLAQNFFGVEPESSRYAAGRGLVLVGNGRGDFRALPAARSGVRMDGEQRGSAVGDLDKDGRVDLLVGQYRGATRVWLNRGAKPGLRVRLAGPAGNPWGLGARIQVLYGDEQGPVREVHGGGGYQSQDSPVLVLGLRRPPSAVRVQWPGGRVTTTPVAVGAAEVAVPAP